MNKVTSQDALAAMETVLLSMRHVGSQLSALKAKVKLYNNALDNLRHAREFNEYTEAEMVKNYKEEHRIAKQRRLLKNEIIALGAFKKLYDDNHGIKEAMQTVVNSMEYAKKRVGSQRYFEKDTGGIL